MKRILVSILLLITAFLLSKSFAAELSNFSEPAQMATGSSDDQAVFQQKQTGSSQLSVAGCPCDAPPSNPTVTLVLIASVTASLAMGSFIYGSYFIANWVAG